MNDTSVFSGFPTEGLQFLRELAVNNNKEWFDEHKKQYQTYLLEPAQAFVTALGTRLQTISNSIRFDTRADGSGTLMRIYRDTRFSKDKSPYKTCIGGKFWEGDSKKTEGPSLGFHLHSDNMGLMTGMFEFPDHILQAYRGAIIDEKLGSELEEIVNSLTQMKQYQINNEYYKRVPSGYDANHKRARFLRYNGLYIHTSSIGSDILTTPELVDACLEHFHKMLPLQLWLAKVIRLAESK